MTVFTGVQFATRVFRDLGAVAAEETPSAADMAFMLETIECEFALLAAKGIPVWNGSDDAIPAEYFTLMSRRVGLAAAPSLGLTDIATATLAMRAAEQDLRILAQTGPTGEVQQQDYF